MFRRRSTVEAIAVSIAVAIAVTVSKPGSVTVTGAVATAITLTVAVAITLAAAIAVAVVPTKKPAVRVAKAIVRLLKGLIAHRRGRRQEQVGICHPGNRLRCSLRVLGLIRTIADGGFLFLTTAASAASEIPVLLLLFLFLDSHRDVVDNNGI